MESRIALITILTDNPAAMVAFYRDVLGFQPQGDTDGGYVEFAHEGVRFAICARSVLAQFVGHPSFSEPARGQSFELAFPCVSPAEVDTAYDALITKGATPVMAPADMPWNQRTACFADPDGYIHEIFADLPAGS